MAACHKLAVCLVVLAFAFDASAAPGDAERFRGRMLAKAGQCDRAIPMLQAAEAASHRPSAAQELAKCFEKGHQLVAAHAQFERIAANKTRQFTWDYYDVVAWRGANKNVQRLEVKIAKLTIEPAANYDKLIVEVNGEPAEIGKAIPLDPGTATIRASAPGFVELEENKELAAGARSTFMLRLEKLPSAAPKPPPKEDPKPEVTPSPSPPSEASELWLGARFVGLFMPQFLMNAVAEGGTTVFIPGGAATLTYVTDSPELVFALAYASYGMGETPFKPNGTPDTDWEIIESDLMSLALTMDVMWAFPIDQAGIASFRIGGSIGVGFMFLGDLTRTQSYPPGFVAGDPSTYRKCNGPNDPPGSFRYCNQLDKDADHYNDFSEPNWFSGGVRPLIYPWVAIPIGLSLKPVQNFKIDIETGFSVAGFSTSAGFRFGL